MPPRPYRGLLPVLLLVLSLGSLAAAVDLRAQPVPIGSEMRLGSTDDIYRESPRAVVDSRGRLVVIWREWESDPAGNRPVRLAGRRFDPEGQNRSRVLVERRARRYAIAAHPGSFRSRFPETPTFQDGKVGPTRASRGTY